MHMSMYVQLFTCIAYAHLIAVIMIICVLPLLN